LFSGCTGGRGGREEERGGRKGTPNVPDEHIAGGWNGEVEAHAQIDDDTALCFLVVKKIFEGHVSVDDPARMKVGQPGNDLNEEATGHLEREGGRRMSE